MKKIYYLFVIGLWLVSGGSYAQIQGYNLSDYQVPNLKRQTLSFDFNGSLNQSSILAEKKSTVLTDKTNKNYNLSKLNVSYWRYSYSRKRETSIYAVSENSLSGAKESSLFDASRKDFSMTNDVGFRFSHREYLNEKIFIETNPMFFLRRNFSSIEYNPSNVQQDVHKKQMDGFSKVDLGIGYGRIEMVSDAQHALFILKDLQQKGRLKENPTTEQINELAKWICKAKNERVLDARMKRIYELKVVDSVLSAMNLISENDITYFASLSDIWEYGDNVQRYSGSRVVLSAELFGEKRFLDEEFRDETGVIHEGYKNQLMPQYSINVTYKYERPLNQFWQIGLDVMGSYGMVDLYWKNHSQDEDWEKSNDEIDYFRLGSMLTCGYYPNTRTHMYTLAKAYYIKENTESINDTRSSMDDLALELVSGVKYFISPRLLCFMDLSLGSYNTLSIFEEESDKLNLGLNTGLVYHIF